jgi:hypothetical protein
MDDNSDCLSPEEIVARFRKVFGREMTSVEPHAFFLTHEPMPSGSEKANSES